MAAGAVTHTLIDLRPRRVEVEADLREAGPRRSHLAPIDERPIERRRREEQERTDKITFHRAVWPDPAALLARRTGGVKVQVTDPDE